MNLRQGQVVRAEARAQAEAKAESLARADRKRQGRRLHPREERAVYDGRIRAGGGILLWSDERDREVENEPAPSMRP